MKCRTGPCQTWSLRTRPCGTKPRRASHNHHERLVLFWYYAVYSGNSLLTFRDNLSVPPSWVKKSKKENSTTEVNWHNLRYWDFVCLIF